MLDIGWPELLLILAVVVFATGPDDIPKLLYHAGRLVRRIQYLKFSLSRQFDELMRESDLESIRKAAAIDIPGPAAETGDQQKDGEEGEPKQDG